MRNIRDKTGLDKRRPCPKLGAPECGQPYPFCLLLREEREAARGVAQQLQVHNVAGILRRARNVAMQE